MRVFSKPGCDMVKLSDILDALEFQSDTMQHYFDRQTNRVVTVSEEDTLAAEDGLDDEAPDWQRESIAAARAIAADEQEHRFVPLPDSFEIDEWDMMRRFASGVEKEDASAALLDAIHGRGAFRYFKDTVRRLGLDKQWFAFRDDAHRAIATEWCQDHDIPLDT